MAASATSSHGLPHRGAGSSRAERGLAEAHRILLEGSTQLLADWRRRFPLATGPAPQLPPRALATLEQLLLPRPVAGREGSALSAWREQVNYTAARLAKLGVPLEQVHAAFAVFRPLVLARLRLRLGAQTACNAQEWLQQQAQLAVAEAYVAAQNSAVSSLLAVLDAELNSATLNQLLQRLLEQAAQLFPIRWGEILLVDAESGSLRLLHAASHGLDPGMILDTAGVGPFFLRILSSGVPGFLLDAANDPNVAQPYYRELEVKSVWAVPLVDGAEVLGILTVAFDRVYECLPKERELLLALAERSSLAIERTRMHERLEREQVRVLELSRRLLDAHEEERRRISRDLHDETGQALLAIRMYLELSLRQDGSGDARKWLHQGLALVDSSVAELRRILAELSPLVLDELGLEAALRLELQRLRAQHHWRTRFQFSLARQGLDRTVEILLYRVVLEGLRNIARHAQARRVHLRLTHSGNEIRVALRDDGRGLPTRGNDGFGVAGMRERVRLAGGRFDLQSEPGQGVRLSIAIPAGPAPAAPPPGENGLNPT